MQSAGYGDGPGWRGGQPEELGGADPYYETLLEEERRAAGLEGVELEEDAAFLSVRDVHGYSVSPIMLPGSNGGVAYATGPFLVIWNWKVNSRSLHAEAHTTDSANLHSGQPILPQARNPQSMPRIARLTQHPIIVIIIIIVPLWPSAG